MTGVFPMTSLDLRPNRHVLPAGTELWRVHNAARAPEEFNPNLADPHMDGNRFDGTRLDPYHCLYLADSPTTALAESVLRSTPFERATSKRLIPWVRARGRTLSAMRARCDLNLISLIEETDLAAVCQDSTLLEGEARGDYAMARRWASEIRAKAPDAMGLIWQSRRNRPRHALVLFHDRFGHCDGKPLEVVPGTGIPDLGSKAGLAEANRLLDPLRAEISEPIGA